MLAKVVLIVMILVLEGKLVELVTLTVVVPLAVVVVLVVVLVEVVQA